MTAPPLVGCVVWSLFSPSFTCPISPRAVKMVASMPSSAPLIYHPVLPILYLSHITQSCENGSLYAIICPPPPYLSPCSPLVYRSHITQSCENGSLHAIICPPYLSSCSPLVYLSHITQSCENGSLHAIICPPLFITLFSPRLPVPYHPEQ